MQLIFLLAAGVVVYIFLGYPFVLAVLSLLFGRKVKKGEFEPAVSLIISAYNEEAVIREKLENSLKLDYPREKLEIIVASESTDNTNRIVGEFSGEGVVLYHYEKREGKRATLFRTVPKAKGEIIVFSDANSIYKPDAIKKLMSNFADVRIGCVSGQLKYRNPQGSAIGKGEGAYWKHDFILKKLASRLFCLGGGVNGSILALRKNLYNPIDKFRGDDLELACRVEIAGLGVVLDPEAVCYEDVSLKSEQEFRRKVRMASWNLVSSSILFKEALLKKRFLTAFLLLSHRILRYTTPIWLILLLLANFFLLSRGAGYKIFFFLEFLFYFMAFLGWFLEKSVLKLRSVFILPFYFCLVNYAALLSLHKVFLGKREMLWEKSR